MRSDSKITLMHILGVRVLHDIIREFARDSVAPTSLCGIVRHVAAHISERRPFEDYYDDPHDPESENLGYDRFSQRYLEHSFLLSYRGHGLVEVHHRTIADFAHEPHVIGSVLLHEIRNVPVDIRADVFYDRFEAWQGSVRGRTWTAACADDWHMWSRAKIEANPTL